MNINHLDVRHLRYFVAVAEELHFGRAAARLNISQPPLSQQIKALEEELGVALFNRTQRHVELTPAGQYLLPEARRLLQDMTHVLHSVATAAEGPSGYLKIGVNFSAPFHPFTTTLFEAFHTAYPNIHLDLVLHDKDTLLQLVDLEAAHLDLALIWLDDSYQSPHLARLDLARDTLDAAVPAAHPLAQRDRIHIRDLADLPFIAQPRYAGTQRFDGIMAAFGSIGREPKIASQPVQMPLVMSLVAAGQGVSILPRFLKALPIAGVAFRPLVLPNRQRPPHMTYTLIAPRAARNAAATLFYQFSERQRKAG